MSAKSHKIIQNNNVIQLKNVAHCANQQQIINKINLTIPIKSNLLITGENSSGKTTLLKIMAGLKKPTAGNVLWENYNLYSNYPNYYAHLKHRYCYIPAAPNLFADLSLNDNLQKIIDLNTNQFNLKIYHKYIEQFKLNNKLDLKFSDLSDGIKKIASILANTIQNNNLKTLLIDEPFTYLDNSMGDILIDYFNQLANNGVSIIASAHLNTNHYANLNFNKILKLPC